MNILKVCFFLICSTSICYAQRGPELAFQRTVKTLGQLSMGTPYNDFARQKPVLPEPDKSIGFRAQVVEKIGKDGLTSITYYFDLDGDNPLYELILEYSNEANREYVSEKLFGKANHPDKPDHWILGVDAGVVSMGWYFGNKFVLAANLPGTEWSGDDLFILPAGFEPHKNLPVPTEWPKEEIARFFNDLQLQVDAGKDKFEQIKGEQEHNYFLSKQSVGMAELSAVFTDEHGQLLVSNVMASNMTFENALQWKAEMEKVINGMEPGRYKLVAAPDRPIFGKPANIWTVQDQTGAATGIQIGLEVFDDTLSSVFVLVMLE